MRSLLMMLFIAPASWAMAQSNHYFEAAEAYDRAQLKFVIQAVVDIDPNANVYQDDGMRLLHVRSNVSEAELRGAIAGAGLALLDGTPNVGTANNGPTATADGKPLFVITGDPAGDQARYAAAVQLWNAQHADEPIEILPIIIE
ncbi:MAG: hypothetical protein KF905_17130 [Flavobacteriales bacterium]|nr:hypothetical protein [Flavobacteriales bacterium]